MNQHTARKIAIDARNEALELFKWVHAERLIGKEARQATERARDILHTACSDFEDGDGHTVFEDLYLPIFDALSFVTGVLNGSDWRRWHDSYRSFILTNTAQAITILESMTRFQPPY